MANIRPHCYSPDFMALFTGKELREILGAKEGAMYAQQLITQLKESKQQKLLQLAAMKRGHNRMPPAVTGPDDKAGRKALHRYAVGITAQARTSTGHVSVENQAFALQATFHRMLSDFMIEAAPKKFGWSVQSGFHEDTIRALWGEQASPEAKAAASAWKKFDAYAVDLHNKYGGTIKKRQDWIAPTHHDPVRVGKVDAQDWIDFIVPRLDLQKMGYTENQLRTMLIPQHKIIATDGMIKWEPGKIGAGMSKIANRHKAARFFHFKDADSWIEYQREFGSPNIYGSMMEHVHLMSKEIAAMNEFGPNPDLGVKAQLDELTRRGLSPTWRRTAQNQWDLFIGHTSGDNPQYQHNMATWRSFQTMTQLPGAVVSAVSDPMWTHTFTRMRGIPQLKNLEFTIKSLFMNVTDRNKINKIAAELQFGIENMIDAAHSANRMSEVEGSDLMARGADVTLRLSGLSPWTVAQKRGHMMAISFMIEKGLHAKGFGYMKNRRKAMYNKYGIDDTDLQIVARAPRITRMGHRFVDWEKVPLPVSTKFIGMMIGETRLAVPEGDLFTKSAMIQGTKAGTHPGEAFRAVGLFKTHPIHIALGPLNMIFRDEGISTGTRLEAMANTFIGVTIMGVIAQQMYEVTRGREMRDWDDPKLWRDGFFRGGGGSIYADLFLQDNTRYGGIASAFAGPQISDAFKVIEATTINSLKKIGEGKASEIPRDLATSAARDLMSRVPLSKLPYTRAVWDKHVNQRVMEIMDRDYRRKTRRRERQRVREYGNKSFMGN